MKNKHQSTYAIILGAAMALFVPQAFAQGNSGNNNSNSGNSGNNGNSGNSGNNGNNNSSLPAIPVGWIDAYPSFVLTGEHTTVSWGVDLPSQTVDVINIEDNTIVLKREACIDCRILGNGVTVTYSNGSWEFVEAQAAISLNGGSFEEVFFGTNHDVKPNEVVWSRTELKKNDKVRFGGKYYWNGSWGPFYQTSSGKQNVRTLVHGDTPPLVKPGEGIPSLEDFIEPYLDPNGNVNIGPMDVIVFMELTHSDDQMEHPGYDMQDMVMICTLKPKAKKNNRSGLADGTNPGQGNQMGNNDGTDNPNNAPHSGGSN